MAHSQALEQVFVNTAVPLVDKNGNITAPWQRLFQALWNRTGQAHGTHPLQAGMVLGFAGAGVLCPACWLYCDGLAVSRTRYAGLYNAIGTSWGPGDGSITFNLPDLTGDEFDGKVKWFIKT